MPLTKVAEFRTNRALGGGLALFLPERPSMLGGMPVPPRKRLSLA